MRAAPGAGEGLGSRAANRLLCVLVLAGTLALGACGDDEAADGEAIYNEISEPTCASCHVLAAAGATATVGPDLDEMQPSASQVEQAVRSGPGTMPDYEGELDDEQIAELAEWIASNAGS